jgi:hypothetical protein
MSIAVIYGYLIIDAKIFLFGSLFICNLIDYLIILDISVWQSIDI